MESLKNPSLKDLLTNDDFIRYIFDDTSSDCQTDWDTLDSESADFQQKVKNAKKILQGDNKQYTLSKEESEQLKGKIFQTLKSKSK